MREAEIASQEEVERTQIASEIGLDEVRIGHQKQRRRLEIEREKAVEESHDGKSDSALSKVARGKRRSGRRPTLPAPARWKPPRKWRPQRRPRRPAAGNRWSVVMAEKAAAEMRIAAEGERVRAAVEAEAQRLINEAENVLTDEARHSLFKRKMLEYVEGIVSGLRQAAREHRRDQDHAARRRRGRRSGRRRRQGRGRRHRRRWPQARLTR